LTIRKNLFDAHVFIFKHWVMDLIIQKPQLSSISNDVIPYIVRCQNSTKFADEENIYNSCYSQLSYVHSLLTPFYSHLATIWASIRRWTWGRKANCSSCCLYFQGGFLLPC
jgi:hypothetical protein